MIFLCSTKSFFDTDYWSSPLNLEHGTPFCGYHLVDSPQSSNLLKNNKKNIDKHFHLLPYLVSDFFEIHQ